MTEEEKKIIHFLNNKHKSNRYIYEDNLILHNVKYQKRMSEKAVELLRESCGEDSLKAAYQLKTYYLENFIPSNTIVLKMRSSTPKSQEIPNIQILCTLDDMTYDYTYYVIEVFKEDDMYKVFDCLHSNEVMTLEAYLDSVTRINNCPRTRLRYDMSMLASAHASAGNMQELSDLMRYLDKEYKIGKPRSNIINVSGSNMNSHFFSDDMAVDVNMILGRHDINTKEFFIIYKNITEKLMSIRFNMLHAQCYFRILHEPIMVLALAEAMFDDKYICRMLNSMDTIDAMSMSMI